jgi:V/A-type H+-transporting ATPase subunit I
MPWRDEIAPMRMVRVGLVAPTGEARAMLTAVARSGAVELELPRTAGAAGDELERALDCGVTSGPVVGFVGWTPAAALEQLRGTLTPLGASVVMLRHPPGVEPPTLLAGRRADAGLSRSLVTTYGTVPYADMDPSRIAGFAYVVMFGMMFGDVGHGAILVLAGLILRTGHPRRFAKWRRIWLFITGAGVSAMAFGFLYGEAFGPTGLVPVLWLSPTASPVPLLIAAIILGAALLAVAYAVGTVNRVREGGWAYALYARTGFAGSALFVAAGALTLGLVWSIQELIVVAVLLAVLALGFIFVGLYVDSGGGGGGVTQAVVELFDTVIGLGTNVVSFARLAAFGLTHAALLAVVWTATIALWSGWSIIAAVVVFVVGNILTFGLEALVAGIQALRLEYYELFSRIFDREGRPFHAWTLETPTAGGDEESGRPELTPLERRSS